MEPCHLLWFYCIQHALDGILSLAGLSSQPSNAFVTLGGARFPEEKLFSQGGGALFFRDITEACVRIKV